jgi:hypothetical protein
VSVRIITYGNKQKERPDCDGLKYLKKMTNETNILRRFLLIHESVSQTQSGNVS